LTLQIDRRSFTAGLVALPVAGCAIHQRGARAMYGLIGTMSAQPGKRSELAAILLEGLRDMPGCLSYIVAEDPAKPDLLWITEVWTDSESHMASLKLPSVQGAIAKGRPLIAAMDRLSETRPLGGQGLV
jgi:quinol monooxygenase YgiN